METFWDTDRYTPVAHAIKKGTEKAAEETISLRPAPSTPEVGVLEKKADWVEKRLRGKKVRLSWRFAGSSNVHEGVCEGITEGSKGKSVMLMLAKRQRTIRDEVRDEIVSHRGVSHLEPVFGPEKVVTAPCPLYVPLRAVLSIEAIP